MRCPGCRTGIVWRRGMQMNNLCPRCGIEFEREPGYFSGAMWISSILAAPFMLLIFVGLLLIFRSSVHPALLGGIAALAYVPLVPLTVRLSRSLWMYFDHQMNPLPPQGESGDDPPETEDRVPPQSPPGAEKGQREQSLPALLQRNHTLPL